MKNGKKGGNGNQKFIATCGCRVPKEQLENARKELGEEMSRAYADAKALCARIPNEVMEKISGKKIIEAGVGTAPSFLAFKAMEFEPPIELIDALIWISQTLRNFRAAHLKFDDRTVLWFDSNDFSRYDEKRRSKRIRPTLAVSIPGDKHMNL